MELKYDTNGAERKFSPNAMRAILSAMHQEATAWAIDEQGAFTEERLNGRPGLKRWSGRLARSLKQITEKSATGFRSGFMFLPTMESENGTVDNYAAIHETGGTVSAKGGKMLAWPVQDGPAVTAGGRNRYGSSPRNYPGKLFFYKARSGQMFLAETFGRGGKRLRLVYHLAKSVQIPARLGFKRFAVDALERVKMRLAESKSRAASEVAK